MGNTSGMSFNSSKYIIMHLTKKRKPMLRDYTIRGQTLSIVDTITYLGIELLPNLIRNKLVEKVAANSNRTGGFIRTVTTSSSEVLSQSSTDGIQHLFQRPRHTN